MQRLSSALAIALLMGAATFVVSNPPPAFQMIRYDEVVLNLHPPFDYQKCLRIPACKKLLDAPWKTPSPQPLRPGESKPDNPFWDWT